MSRSLIRKNQLHPDISDLISGYGDNFFITPVELAQSLINFQGGLPISGIVYTNGNQTISGLKNFATRPTVNGTNVLLQGEVNIANLVYTTGNQTINGIKNFTSRPTVNGVGVLLQGEAAAGGGSVENAVYTTGSQTITSVKNFTLRPTLNGIGFATTGEVGGASTAFNGARPITLQVAGFQNLQPNGDNVVTFLDNLFYPFTQAQITLDSFNTIYELGGPPLNTVSCIGTITTGNVNINQITSLQAVVNNNAVPQIVLSPSTSFSFSAEVNLTNSANIKVKANSRNKNNQVVEIESNPQTIYFEPPFYFGAGAANLTPAQITGQLTKRIEFPSDKTLPFTATNQKLYFAYPASWGSVTNVIDQNGFNNTADWSTRSNLTFSLLNGSTLTYIVREKILSVTFPTAFNYTFDF